jgi:hypothetical protein
MQIYNFYKLHKLLFMKLRSLHVMYITCYVYYIAMCLYGSRSLITNAAVKFPFYILVISLMKDYVIAETCSRFYRYKKVVFTLSVPAVHVILQTHRV